MTACLVTPAALYGAPIQGICLSALDQMRVQAAALSRAGHAGYRCAWTNVALHSDPVATYARAVARQWAAMYHGQANNRAPMAGAWRHALARQDASARPALTVRGPAAATVLFLRYLGYSLSSEPLGAGTIPIARTLSSISGETDKPTSTTPSRLP